MKQLANVDFMGLQGFFWFFGMVEDRNDPKKLGRVRVRVLGIHTELINKNPDTGQGIPVNELPWAVPMLPVTSPCISGIGQSSHLIEGTWVFGFARDGRTYQDLVIMGTFSGIPENAPKLNKGFNDTIDATNRPKRPDETSVENYPKKKFVGENDTNRLARNELINDTIVQKKKNSEDKNVPVANSSATWSEQPNPYNATYPFNYVTESESGHIHEVDDTPNNERLHSYHRSGTFEEISPDGTRVTKIIGKDYEIIHSDKNVHIKGNLNITVDGDANLYIKGNANEQIDGNSITTIAGNCDLTVSGNLSHTVTGTYTLSSSGNMTFKAPRIDHFQN